MRTFAAAFVAATMLLAAPAFADDDVNADVMKPIQQFSDGMSKGDVDKAAEAHVATPTIIDEFPPYTWAGTGSFAAWGADFGKDSTAKGIENPKLAVGKVHRMLVDGDHAYVVADAMYTFKQNGMVMGENATMTFVLNKTADGWKIAAWSFNY